MHSPRPSSESGFTLVEMLVAATLLVVGILAVAAMISQSSRANAATRQHDAATNIARELIESARGIPYDRISSPAVTAELQNVPGLEASPAPGYTLRRNGTTFTVAIDVCVMDDPKDGGGPRSATATFCANSAPAGTQDKNPEDYKRLTTTVSWTRDGRARSVQQTGIINNPGSASGPAIRSIIPRGYAAPYIITDPAVTSLVVDVTTSSNPAAINWLVDGTVKQPPPTQNGASGLAWAFTWNIGPVDSGVLDGDYILSAEAFNQYGVSGPGRQETVILNRRIPFKPKQVTGGRTNFGTVEIEWTANSERDIVGYEVYRENTPTPICALATQRLETSCVDPSPPAAGSVVHYWVVAYDKDSATGAPRKGDLSDPLNVKSDNLPPFAPTELTGARAADGTVTLTWKRPSPEDPDAGDGVEFYRVYRDGQQLTDRIARWFDNAGTVTWQDTETGGTTHTYWVTAVDRNYAESPYLGPVTK